jgi:hypothetical protein
MHCAVSSARPTTPRIYDKHRHIHPFRSLVAHRRSLRAHHRHSRHPGRSKAQRSTDALVQRATNASQPAGPTHFRATRLPSAGWMLPESWFRCKNKCLQETRTAIPTAGTPPHSAHRKHAQTQGSHTPHSHKMRKAAERRWNAPGELVSGQTQVPVPHTHTHAHTHTHTQGHMLRRTVRPQKRTPKDIRGSCAALTQESPDCSRPTWRGCCRLAGCDSSLTTCITR